MTSLCENVIRHWYWHDGLQQVGIVHTSYYRQKRYLKRKHDSRGRGVNLARALLVAIPALTAARGLQRMRTVNVNQYLYQLPSMCPLHVLDGALLQQQQRLSEQLSVYSVLLHRMRCSVPNSFWRLLYRLPPKLVAKGG